MATRTMSSTPGTDAANITTLDAQAARTVPTDFRGRFRAVRRWGAESIVRATCAIALAATYAVTWGLWQARGDPPNLPIVGPLAGLPFGLVLVVAALSAIRFPRAGALVHAGVLVLALLGDQLRIQPELVSLGLLLLAAGFGPRCEAIGRWHLTALWTWAGLNKLLSAGWTFGNAGFIAEGAGLSGQRALVAVAVPLAELGLGLLSMSRRTWGLVRFGAPLLHVSIVGVLYSADWNRAVWPWNLALAIVAPALFRSAVAERPRPSRPGRPDLLVTATAGLFLLEPAGFYVGDGLGHPYLQHHLYSSDVPSALRCDDDGCSPFDTWDDLEVPVPPWPRTFRDWFEDDCRPGDELRITGRRTRFGDPEPRSYACPPADP